MKKISTLILILIGLAAYTQTTMNIYQSNGSVLQIPIGNIDTITYTIPNTGTLATLTTLSVGSITSATATSGGNITSDGGSPVTQRGVCYSTTTAPTIANNRTTDGSGTGNYTSNLTGLAATTTYYVRAYSTNSAGTAYGNELSFTTIANTLATLTTLTVGNIDSTSATSGGHVSNTGGSPVTQRGVCYSTTPYPTIANSKTTDGSGTGNYTSNLTGLAVGTTYYVRAYATNSAGTAYGNQLGFTTKGGSGSVVSNPGAGVNDMDGNQYTSVILGNGQEWMVGNLKTTRYSNGDIIGEIEDNTIWSNILNNNDSTPAWCYYNTNAAINTTYGKLYNWYAVADPRNVCPTGWHVPSDTAFQQLSDYLGGDTVAGGKMKTITLWVTPNTAATNESGFSGAPGGLRTGNGMFSSLGAVGFWWSSTGYDIYNTWYRQLNYNSAGTSVYNTDKTTGLSVRCLRN